ncbi:winged helix domain-containing protein, partial [Oceanospirillum sp. HFRX-1_2]
YMTQPKYLDQLVPAEKALTQAELEQEIANGMAICLSEGSRLAFSRTENGILLFADGDGFDVSEQDQQVALFLTEHKHLTEDELSSSSCEFKEIILELINRGSLFLSD